jgi:hypothetical protein
MSGMHSPSPAPPPPIRGIPVGATSAMINDFTLAHAIGPAARELLGEPTRATPTELRYGTNGSLSIDLTKGTFNDHERGQGGGCLAFVMRYANLDKVRSRGSRYATTFPGARHPPSPRSSPRTST